MSADYRQSIGESLQPELRAEFARRMLATERMFREFGADALDVHEALAACAHDVRDDVLAEAAPLTDEEADARLWRELRARTHIAESLPTGVRVDFMRELHDTARERPTNHLSDRAFSSMLDNIAAAIRDDFECDIADRAELVALYRRHAHATRGWARGRRILAAQVGAFSQGLAAQCEREADQEDAWADMCDRFADGFESEQWGPTEYQDVRRLQRERAFHRGRHRLAWGHLNRLVTEDVRRMHASIVSRRPVQRRAPRSRHIRRRSNPTRAGPGRGDDDSEGPPRPRRGPRRCRAA